MASILNPVATGMASIVSSGLDYIQKNPRARLTFGQIEHELQHVKIRERVSSFISLASTACLIFAVATVIAGGMFVVGALAAIAGLSALYAMAAREAESQLRSKQIGWINEDPSMAKIPQEDQAVNSGWFGLNWFSSLSGK